MTLIKLHPQKVSPMVVSGQGHRTFLDLLNILIFKWRNIISLAQKFCFLILEILFNNYDFNYHLYMMIPKFTFPSQALVWASYLFIQLSLQLFIWRSKMTTKSHHNQSFIYFLPYLFSKTCLCPVFCLYDWQHYLSCAKLATLSLSPVISVECSVLLILSEYLLSPSDSLCLHLSHPGWTPFTSLVIYCNHS